MRLGIIGAAVRGQLITIKDKNPLQSCFKMYLMFNISQFLRLCFSALEARWILNNKWIQSSCDTAKRATRVTVVNRSLRKFTS